MKGKWYQSRQVQAAFLLGLLTIVAAIVAALMSRSSSNAVLVHELDEPPPTPAKILRILTPTAGGQVGLTEVVRADSPYADYNHYIVVESEGSRWIVDGPMTRAQAGELTGSARFGAGDVGIGKQFSLSVVAVRGVLTEGDLSKSPEGSTFSKSVTVLRVR